MSTYIRMPKIGDPPLPGRVVKVRRMRGHHSDLGDELIDIAVGRDVIRLCAPDSGTVTQVWTYEGDQVAHGRPLMEFSSSGGTTYEVFIAYRQSDSPAHAGRICDRLVDEFGRGQVFRDVESLNIGEDFREVIRNRLKNVIVMVVLVGPQWIEGPDGKRRLDDENDLHREEIATAIAQKVDLIPVRVNGAHVPSVDDVPEILKPLLGRLALEVSESRWESDMKRLIDGVRGCLAKAPARNRIPYRQP